MQMCNQKLTGSQLAAATELKGYRNGKTKKENH